MGETNEILKTVRLVLVIAAAAALIILLSRIAPEFAIGGGLAAGGGIAGWVARAFGKSSSGGDNRDASERLEQVGRDIAGIRSDIDIHRQQLADLGTRFSELATTTRSRIESGTYTIRDSNGHIISPSGFGGSDPLDGSD